jgi:uncharacterized protein
MKIWLDTLSHSNHLENECIKDCDPPSRGWFTDISWPPATGDIALVRALTLQHAQALYVQKCSDGRWLVCNPSGSGQIAVLDTPALSLFALFRTPTPLSQVAHLTQGSIERIVTLFYHLGFLQDISTSSPPSLPEGSQTLTAWLHVTNECNLRCHYCYLHKTQEDMPADVGRRTVNAIFRSARKHDIKNVKLKYAGGEASLHMTSVINLHDYASQLALEYGISLKGIILSNGVTLSQSAIDHIKSRHIAVMISLDGLGVYHDSQRPLLGGQGSSQYVQRTIDRLLANDVVPSLSVTVSQRNLAGLPELMQYMLERALPFSLNYYRDNECSTHIADLRFSDEQAINAMLSAFAVIEKNLPERSLLGCLLDKADMTTQHRRTCGVGQNYLVIDQHGGVAKCQMDIKHTVTTVDSDDPLHIIREDRQRVQGLPVEEKEGCRACSWRYWCTGGCPILTYKSTGRYDVKSPNCAIYKALFPEVLRLEALRLLRYKAPFDFDSR